MRSPTRRAALAVCVALLLVTAGCNGGTAPTSTAPATTTSTTTTTTGTPTTNGTWSPNATVEQYPPGIASNGTLTNASRLVNAHFNATANKSVELTYKGAYSDQHFVNRYAHGTNQTPYYSKLNRTHTSDSGHSIQRAGESYQTGSHGYIKDDSGPKTDYTVTQDPSSGGSSWLDLAPYTARRTMWGHLSTGNYTVNGTVERDGQTFVQLTANGSTPPDKLPSYEGTALVTPGGVVYNIDGSFGPPDDEYDESISLDTDVKWSGAPPWVADLPHLSLSVVQDERALEIRNTGGAALPANVSFDVYGRNTTTETVEDSDRSTPEANGTVTTDTRLEPGDAVYVTAGADGDSSSFALHDEPARGDYAFRFAGLHGTHEHISYRLVTGVKTSQNE